MSKPNSKFPTTALPAYQEIQQDLDSNASFTQQTPVTINANYANSGAITITAAGTPFSTWPGFGYVQNQTSSEMMFYNSITGGNTLNVPAVGRGRQGTSAAAGSIGQNVNFVEARVCGTLLNQLLAEIDALEKIRLQTDFTSTPQTLTTAQSWQTFSNVGAGAEVTINLPASAVGLRYSFYVDNAFGIKIVPNGTDVINEGDIGSTASTGYVEGLQANTFLEIQCCKAGVWIVTKKTGAWGFA